MSRFSAVSRLIGSTPATGAICVSLNYSLFEAYPFLLLVHFDKGGVICVFLNYSLLGVCLKHTVKRETPITTYCSATGCSLVTVFYTIGQVNIHNLFSVFSHYSSSTIVREVWYLAAEIGRQNIFSYFTPHSVDTKIIKLCY